jgi:ABC-type uncharacterized transport system auxiliary subunit
MKTKAVLALVACMAICALMCGCTDFFENKTAQTGDGGQIITRHTVNNNSSNRRNDKGFGS